MDQGRTSAITLPVWSEIEAALLNMARSDAEMAIVRHLVDHTAAIAPTLTSAQVLWELLCISNMIGPPGSALRGRCTMP